MINTLFSNSSIRGLAYLFCCSILISCSFGEKSQQANPMIEAQKVPSYVDYRVEKIDKKSGPCVTDTTAKQCLLFQIEYPVITGKIEADIMDKINASIEDDILSSAPIENDAASSIKEMIDGLSEDYEALLKDFTDYEQPWLVEINADILHQDTAYISLASSIFTYTGGAHPNNNQLYKSYDLRTGRAVKLGDLFLPGFENQLNESAEIEFRMLKEIPPGNSLKSAGYWFEDDQFVLSDNFAIINKSLIFYYNPYDIGPYSLGATELELKLTDYIDLIKPKGILGHLLDSANRDQMQ